MRITNNYQYEQYQYNIQNAEQKLANISQQLSTGKRINQPSDDPVGISQAISMTSLQAGIKQYMANLSTAKGSLGVVDNTASSMTTLVNQAYQLAVQGASSTTDQTARNAMVSQISTLQSQLVNLANAQGPDGSYIFAGQKNNQAPYSVSGNTLTFNGDTNPINVEVGPGQTLRTSTPGEPLISTTYNALETLKTDLTGGQVGAISGIDIANMQSALDSISTLRGDAGARMQTVNAMTSQYQVQSDTLTQNISNIEDVDMAAAAVQFQQANEAYSAALSVTSAGSSLSLINFIQNNP